MKLLDFGIAKQLESLDSPAEQTRTGLRLMTPAYAAPEQIRGGRVGIHTDVYSLGVVLYELLDRPAAVRPHQPDAGRSRAWSITEYEAGEAVGGGASHGRPGRCAARGDEPDRPGPTSTCSASPRCTRIPSAATAPSTR